MESIYISVTHSSPSASSPNPNTNPRRHHHQHPRRHHRQDEEREMPRPPRQHEHRVPRHFFCPISGTFMREPVIVPATQETCDLEALRTRRRNTRNFPLEDQDEDQDELLMPDFHVRSQVSAWLDKYKRRPTFAYVSTPQDLETAVTSLLTQEPHDILEDSDLLKHLRELKSHLEHKIPLINSAPCYSLLLRLIEGCPVSPENAAEWVKISVGILAKAENIQIENPSLFANYRRTVLEVIDRVKISLDFDRILLCVDIEDSDFEDGLVNLLCSFMKLELEDTEHIITSHGEVIKALSSYILIGTYYRRYVRSDESFHRLFDVIMKLWVTEEGLKQPKLSQAVASLVWPIRRQITNAQYENLLRSISSVLRPSPDDLDDNDRHNSMESSLALMTRAGLVSKVFLLLDYTTLDDDVRNQDPLGWVVTGRTVSDAEEENMILRSFEILCSLSSVTIGRLEMVRVIKRSGFKVLDGFYSAIARVILPETVESHVIPALCVLCNLVENTRYTERGDGSGFDQFRAINFENFNHEGLTTIARNFFAAVDRIETEEAVSEDEDY